VAQRKTQNEWSQNWAKQLLYQKRLKQTNNQNPKLKNKKLT
jgi:hypothetical protein